MRVLDRFFKSRIDGERVIGSYLYPICLLGEPDWSGPDSAIEVVASVTVDAKEILITRMSGLFVRPPPKLSNPYQQPADAPIADDLKAKLGFEDAAAQAFNKVICEFCLCGVVSQPVSPVHISFGQLIDGHALVVVGSGGRETYLERTIGPNTALLNETWRMWPFYPETVLENAASLTRANKLAEVSPSVPEFVAGAYSLYSQRQLNEALEDSWVVCEQLLNYLWLVYCRELEDRRRKNRLYDSRTYSASVRLEVLRTAKVLPDSLYQALHKARVRRNDLLHEAKNNFEATEECMVAMKMTLEHILGEEIAEPLAATGVTW